MNFIHQARQSIGHHVKVMTAHDTFTGTLLSVGSDFLVIRVRHNRNEQRLLIRLESIIALSRSEEPTSLEDESSHTASMDDDDLLEQYLLEADDE
ncbi:DUF2642 domain-containing protein [Anoxybacteroides tepidamans]|uniref:DUF2642 domain-containing protein n=1 Tax=Anoxybacteroides tepidamans TaxID=265948 RepID=UPI00048523B9|nr:DUF2642 domain-containing protein [Anoxybacillus tepidamans]